MPKWFSRRLSISSVCRLSMPSFLKKSSSGASEPAGTLKCLDARSSTSWVVCSSVRMEAQIYHFPGEEKNAGPAPKPIKPALRQIRHGVGGLDEFFERGHHRGTRKE